MVHVPRALPSGGKELIHILRMFNVTAGKDVVSLARVCAASRYTVQAHNMSTPSSKSPIWMIPAIYPRKLL